MKVKNLIEKLRRLDQDAEVEVRVGWAGDTACSDDSGEIEVVLEDGRAVVSGWMSNCSSELHFVEGD